MRKELNAVGLFTSADRSMIPELILILESELCMAGQMDDITMFYVLDTLLFFKVTCSTRCLNLLILALAKSSDFIWQQLLIHVHNQISVNFAF